MLLLVVVIQCAQCFCCFSLFDILGNPQFLLSLDNWCLENSHLAHRWWISSFTPRTEFELPQCHPALVAGGREYHMYPPNEGKDYTWYFLSGIYCQLGDYILPTTFWKDLNNPLIKKLSQGIVVWFVILSYNYLPPPPGKLTRPMKRDHFQRKIVFKPSFFRGELLVLGEVGNYWTRLLI